MIKRMMDAIRGIGQSPALPENVDASAENPIVASRSIEVKTVKSPQTGVRNFNAARTDRYASSWLSSDIAINALLQSQLSIMRSRSRQMTRNTSAGKRFLRLVQKNIIGPDGIQLQSRCGQYVNGVFKLDDIDNSAIETHFKTWCKAAHCDVTGRQSFAEMQRMWASCLAQDGEILIKEVRGTKNTPYRYQLQTLAIDRLDINYNATANNGNVIRMGVETDSSGKAVAYYVLLRNPNDTQNRNTQARERIDANDIIHRFIAMDPEQVRGVPWTHAVISGDKMLAMFQDAAVQAAVVGASNMGFYVPPEPGTAAYVPPSDASAGVGAEVADAVDANGNLMKDAIGGAFEVLPPGYDFKTFNPNYPQQNYGPFVKELKQDIAAGLDVAHHNLSGDMNGVNYSSARIAELSERDGWRTLQAWMIEHIVQPIVERWLELSLLAGAITTSNGSALPATKIEKFRSGLTFVPRGWDWVDPLKEVSAVKMAREEGLTTRSQAVAAKGGDFEDNIIELAREEALLKKHNIKLGQSQPANAISTQNEGEPQDAQG